MNQVGERHGGRLCADGQLSCREGGKAVVRRTQTSEARGDRIRTRSTGGSGCGGKPSRSTDHAATLPVNKTGEAGGKGGIHRSIRSVRILCRYRQAFSGNGEALIHWSGRQPTTVPRLARPNGDCPHARQGHGVTTQRGGSAHHRIANRQTGACGGI